MYHNLTFLPFFSIILQKNNAVSGQYAQKIQIIYTDNFLLSVHVVIIIISVNGSLLKTATFPA